MSFMFKNQKELRIDQQLFLLTIYLCDSVFKEENPKN